MRIYDLTNGLKGVFPLSTGDYQRLLDIMNQGGLGLLVDYFLIWNAEDSNPLNFNHAAVLSILDHVIRRTIAFGKPVEAITIPEIVEGKKTCGIPRAAASRRTIIDNLDQLVRSDLLIKIRFRQTVSQRVLYGIHFYYLLAVPFCFWSRDLDGSRPKALAAQRLFERMETGSALVEKVKGDFDRLASFKNPLPDFDSLIVPWRKD